MKGYIQTESQTIQLGLKAGSWFEGPIAPHLSIAQFRNLTDGRRSRLGMDVRFDDLSIIAESITIPEPCSLTLLAIGGLALLKRKA